MPRDVELDEYIEMLEDKHAMKTCATCRFMVGVEWPDGAYMCSRIKENMGVGDREASQGDLAMIDASHGEYSDKLIVTGAFGCVLHEEKEG